jgi:hypothetical protein
LCGLHCSERFAILQRTLPHCKTGDRSKSTHKTCVHKRTLFKPKTTVSQRHNDNYALKRRKERAFIVRTTCVQVVGFRLFGGTFEKRIRGYASATISLFTLEVITSKTKVCYGERGVRAIAPYAPIWIRPWPLVSDSGLILKWKLFGTINSLCHYW